MTAALEAVAAGGLAEVAGASLRVLELLAVIVLPALALRWLLRRRNRVTHLVILPPADREATQPWPAPRPACPWCDTHECLDSTLCNCEQPCGSWLCVIKEANK